VLLLEDCVLIVVCNSWLWSCVRAWRRPNEVPRLVNLSTRLWSFVFAAIVFCIRIAVFVKTYEFFVAKPFFTFLLHRPCDFLLARSLCRGTATSNYACSSRVCDRVSLWTGELAIQELILLQGNYFVPEQRFAPPSVLFQDLCSDAQKASLVFRTNRPAVFLFSQTAKQLLRSCLPCLSLISRSDPNSDSGALL